MIYLVIAASGQTTYFNRLDLESFIIKKKIAPNIIKLDCISDRIAAVLIKISFNSKCRIIQTFIYSVEEITFLYKDITTLLDRNRSTYTVMIGDFNVKMGRQQVGNEGTSTTMREMNEVLW